MPCCTSPTPPTTNLFPPNFPTKHHHTAPRCRRKPKLHTDATTLSVCLGISFLAVFVVLLGIGAGAPDVLLVKTSGGSDETSGAFGFRDGLNFYSTTFSLSREHQLFWQDLRLGTGGLDEDSLPTMIDVDDIEITVRWVVSFGG